MAMDTRFELQKCPLQRNVCSRGCNGIVKPLRFIHPKVSIPGEGPLHKMGSFTGNLLYYVTYYHSLVIYRYINKTSLSSFTGGSIEYSIVSGDASSYFDIDSGSGEIRTTAAVDYEKVSSVLLNIEARSGNPPAYGRAQVSFIPNIVKSVIYEHCKTCHVQTASDILSVTVDYLWARFIIFCPATPSSPGTWTCSMGYVPKTDVIV